MHKCFIAELHLHVVVYLAVVKLRACLHVMDEDCGGASDCFLTELRNVEFHSVKLLAAVCMEWCASPEQS